MGLDVVDRLHDLPEGDYQYRSRAELLTFREELRSARDGAFDQMRRITDSAAGRSFTNAQASDFTAAERRCDRAGQLAETVERTLVTKGLDLSSIIVANGSPHGDLARIGADALAAVVGSPDSYSTDRPLTRSQTFAGWTRARGQVPTPRGRAGPRPLLGWTGHRPVGFRQ